MKQCKFENDINFIALYNILSSTNNIFLFTQAYKRTLLKHAKAKRSSKEATFHISQADGEITLTSPLIPTLKSDHFLTLPSPPWHDLDSFDISVAFRALFHMFRSVSSPRKAWVASKSPPEESWSCPMVRIPFVLITCPVCSPVPLASETPSL